jgi:hypothetical protein
MESEVKLSKGMSFLASVLAYIAALAIAVGATALGSFLYSIHTVDVWPVVVWRHLTAPSGIPVWVVYVFLILFLLSCVNIERTSR